MFATNYDKHGWLMFKITGSSSLFRKKCRSFLLVDCMLHFDVQLGGSTLVFCLNGIFEDDAPLEEVISASSLGIALTVIWFLLGFFAVSLIGVTWN